MLLHVVEHHSAAFLCDPVALRRLARAGLVLRCLSGWRLTDVGRKLLLGATLSGV